ncbi:MAG: hypothetical protein U0871_18675 [Gemmataceae bacterium]
MELEGVVQNGVIVPDDPTTLPEEGTRVRFEPAPPSPEKPKTFGDYFAEFCGVITDAPADLSAQHDHYRLGVPKR